MPRREITFDLSSLDAVQTLVRATGGSVVFPYQFVPVTTGSSFVSRFECQRVLETGSGTMLIENVLRHGQVPYAVYWTAIECRAGQPILVALPRQRDGHHVTSADLGAHWITVASQMAGRNDDLLHQPRWAGRLARLTSSSSSRVGILSGTAPT